MEAVLVESMFQIFDEGLEEAALILSVTETWREQLGEESFDLFHLFLPGPAGYNDIAQIRLYAAGPFRTKATMHWKMASEEEVPKGKRLL